MNRITRDRALWLSALAIAYAAAIALAALAALDNGASDLEAMQQTALAVEDTDAAGRQISADHLFNQRVQLAGDVVCIRTAGPGYRAAWDGPSETLHCVSKTQPQTQPHRRRLLLADGRR